MKRREFTKTAGICVAGLGSAALAGCMDNPTDGGNQSDGGGNDDGDGNGDDQQDGDVEVTDTMIEVTNVESGTEVSEAEINFNQDAGEVVVTGTITGSDGCKTAALESATYDEDADELSVRVVTRDREDAGDSCTQVLVEIDYSATVEFRDTLPHNAVVYHDGEQVSGGSWESESSNAGAPAN